MLLDEFAKKSSDIFGKDKAAVQSGPSLLCISAGVSSQLKSFIFLNEPILRITVLTIFFLEKKKNRLSDKTCGSDGYDR